MGQLLLSPLAAKNYFFHSTLGSDTNAGTSILAPFQTLAKASSLVLEPGDSLLLASGQVFKGSLILTGQQGKKERPIVVTTYHRGPGGAGQAAQINAAGYANGILLENCAHVQVSRLDIRADAGGILDDGSKQVKMRCGLLVHITKAGNYAGIALDQLCISDIFFEEKGFSRGDKEVRTANGTQRYGWGIRVITQREDARLKGLLIRHCQVENVAHTGIKLTGRKRNIEAFVIEECQVRRSGGPGIQMSGVKNGAIRDNFVTHSGSKDDSRKWGRGSGLWTWGSADVRIEHNEFHWANGPGDSAGCHIDFNCENVIVQYNMSANNAGGFCEILGNNYNCAYRYNISYNDGYRIKGKQGAFQEGKTFWLSGYAGKNRARTGPFNSYFYNNTIVVDSDIVAKFAVDRAADGLLIMNNIFCIRGESSWVLGDQYRPEKNGPVQIRRVVFQNNLFLSSDNWPKSGWIQPKDKSIGDPILEITDQADIFQWVPRNRELVKGKGLPIPKIPGDSIGLQAGLQPAYDILGNPIEGSLSLGAIHVSQ